MDSHAKTAHRILVVEDNAAIVEVLELLLKDTGYEVLTTTDGHSVERLMQEWQPDVVLLDLLLPGLQGEVICQQIKSHTTLKHIPLVLMSAHHDLQERAEQAGADGYLRKPFSIDILTGTIERAFGSFEKEGN
jgi:two-component system phosphate regulon response regulator PhoB